MYSKVRMGLSVDWPVEQSVYQWGHQWLVQTARHTRVSHCPVVSPRERTWHDLGSAGQTAWDDRPEGERGLAVSATHAKQLKLWMAIHKCLLKFRPTDGVVKRQCIIYYLVKLSGFRILFLRGSKKVLHKLYTSKFQRFCLTLTLKQLPKVQNITTSFQKVTCLKVWTIQHFRYKHLATQNHVSSCQMVNMGIFFAYATQVRIPGL